MSKVEARRMNLSAVAQTEKRSEMKWMRTLLLLRQSGRLHDGKRKGANEQIKENGPRNNDDLFG